MVSLWDSVNTNIWCFKVAYQKNDTRVVPVFSYLVQMGVLFRHFSCLFNALVCLTLLCCMKLLNIDRNDTRVVPD